jgi:hypothetical protein
MSRAEFKFSHINDQFGRRTIGYRINDDAGVIDFAIAQCNPSDQFSKELGRNIVTGRINKGGHHAHSGLPRAYKINLSDVGTKYRDIIEYINSNY